MRKRILSQIQKQHYLQLLPVFTLILAVLACSIPPGSGEEPTPEGNIEAKEAILTYARDVLGLEISNLVAGGGSGDVNLPVSTQDGVELALDLAGTSYFGFWKNGVASLSFGDADVSGDFIANVRDGTLAVFGLTVNESLPADASAATARIGNTYPKLSSYSWEEIPAEHGYAFRAAQPEDVSVMSWSVELTGTTIRAGVSPGIGANRTLVWVVLATGELSKPFN